MMATAHPLCRPTLSLQSWMTMPCAQVMLIRSWIQTMATPPTRKPHIFLMALLCRWDRHAISTKMLRITAISFTPMHESLRDTKTAWAQHVSRLWKVAAMPLLIVCILSCGTQSHLHSHPLIMTTHIFTSLEIPMNIHVSFVQLLRKATTLLIRHPMCLFSTRCT